MSTVLTFNNYSFSLIEYNQNVLLLKLQLYNYLSLMLTYCGHMKNARYSSSITSLLPFKKTKTNSVFPF